MAKFHKKISLKQKKYSKLSAIISVCIFSLEIGLGVINYWYHIICFILLMVVGTRISFGPKYLEPNEPS